jgi:lysophospholipase L1-like esterase
MPKTIKEVYQDYGGNTTIEYSDDSVRKFSVDDVPTVSTNPLTGVKVLLDSSGAKIPLDGRIAKSGVVSQRLFGGQSSSLVGTGRTVAMQIPTDVNFIGVRLLLANWQIADTLNIDLCKVAVSAVDNDNGAGLTWTPVTFGGSNSIVVPAGTQGTVGGGGATVNKIGKFSTSDVIWLPSIPRTDVVGAPRFLHIRTYAAGNVYTETPAVFAGSAPTFFGDRGYIHRYQAATGDQVTTTGAMTLATNLFFPSIAGVDFITGQANHFSIMAFGDSLTHGSSASYQSGWPVMLNYLLRQNGKPAAVAQFGVGGMLHENYIANMKGMISVNKPSAVIFSGFSPNSASSTQAGMDNQYARTVEAVEWCKRQGVVPIVTTAKPVNTDNASNVSLKLALNTRFLTELATICQVVDLAGVVRDPADYGKINPLYSLDGTHINDTGLAMEAQKLYTEVFA